MELVKDTFRGLCGACLSGALSHIHELTRLHVAVTKLCPLFPLPLPTSHGEVVSGKLCG